MRNFFLIISYLKPLQSHTKTLKNNQPDIYLRASFHLIGATMKLVATALVWLMI